MKTQIVIASLLICSMMSFTSSVSKKKKTLYDFEMEKIDDEKVSFETFKGKPILIVNTASKCGFTKQYEGLQKLYDKYNGDLVIIGFPANNFMGQEPGSNDQIAAFCKKNYGVTFPMAKKSSVKGKDQSELFAWLTSQSNEDFDGDIKWNFEKFLINKEGKLIRRFRSGEKPMDENIVNAVDKALK